MIHFGPAGSPIGTKTTEEGVKRVSDLGLDAMEVQFVRGVRMKAEMAKEVGKLAKELNVHLSAHAPYYVNLNSQKPETIEKSKEHILRTAEVADALGAEVIAIHAGYYSGTTSTKATEMMSKGLDHCAEKIQENGWKVLIGLETMGRVATWGTLDEIGEVCATVEGVIPVLDFAHIHARSGGFLKTEEDFEELLERYEEIFDEFLHSHFTCINYGKKGEKNHLTLEAKEPDFAALAPVLKNKKYDITIISESPILDEDSLKMKEMIERV